MKGTFRCCLIVLFVTVDIALRSRVQHAWYSGASDL